MVFPDRLLMWVLRLILSPSILQNLAIAVSNKLSGRVDPSLLDSSCSFDFDSYCSVIGVCATRFG